MVGLNCPAAATNPTMTVFITALVSSVLAILEVLPPKTLIYWLRLLFLITIEPMSIADHPGSWLLDAFEQTGVDNNLLAQRLPHQWQRIRDFPNTISPDELNLVHNAL